MNAHDPKHLTADELDAFLTDSSSQLVASHLATCPACASMVEQDGHLIAMLKALPISTPQPASATESTRGLAPRQAPAAPPGPATPRSRSQRGAGQSVRCSSQAEAWRPGFARASSNRPTRSGGSAPALQDTGHALWLSLQTVVANATEQPWFSSLRDTMATPARALFVVAAAAGSYAIALMGLRRLMTEPATDAGW